MTNPKNIHDGLRRAQVLIEAVFSDLDRFTDPDNDHVHINAQEYLQDVREAALDAKQVLAWVRGELASNPRLDVHEAMRLAGLLATARVRRYAVTKSPNSSAETPAGVKERVEKAKFALYSYLKGTSK